MKLFLKRYFAYLFDCGVSYAAVMLLLQWLVLSPIRKLWGIDEAWFHESWNLQLYVWISISLPVWCYFAFLDSQKARGTLGKRLLRVEVVNEQGNAIGLGKSFVRTFFKLLPWELAHVGVIFPSPLYFAESGDIRPLTIVGLVLLCVYALSILMSSNRQCIYDKVLGTHVQVKPALDKTIIIEKDSK